jgi:hypothetical protein
MQTVLHGRMGTVVRLIAVCPNLNSVPFPADCIIQVSALRNKDSLVDCGALPTEFTGVPLFPFSGRLLCTSIPVALLVVVAVFVVRTTANSPNERDANNTHRCRHEGRYKTVHRRQHEQ